MTKKSKPKESWSKKSKQVDRKISTLPYTNKPIKPTSQNKKKKYLKKNGTRKTLSQ